MKLRNWLFRPVRRPSTVRTSRPLRAELLEDRTTPATTRVVGVGDGVNGLINAIVIADPGDTIRLPAGTFNSPGTITKPLTILGPNDGIDPNTGARGTEAKIDTSAGQIVYSGAGNLTIRGVSFDVAGGKGAVATTGTTTAYSIDFSFNRVIGQTPGTRDVYVDTYQGANYTSAVISHNLFDKTSDPGHAAVRVGAGTGAVISANVFTGGYSAVQLFADNLNGIASGPVVTNNRITTTSAEAIQIGENVISPQVTNNTITGANTSNDGNAGTVRVYGGNAGTQGDIVITGNLITGSNNGIVFTNGPAPTSGLTGITITGNSITVNPGTTPLKIVSSPGYGKTVTANGNFLGSADPAAVRAAVASPDLGVQAYLTAGTNAAAAGTNGFVPAASVAAFVPNPAAGPVSGNIQAGIDVAATYGLQTLLIQAGNFTGNVTVGARTLTIDVYTAAGADGIGTVGIAGNLSLGSGTTLRVQADDAANDKFVITGGIASLGGADLDLQYAGTTPAATYTAIDSPGAVAGTFAGLAPNATVTLGAFPYAISYAAGGDSGDVVLSKVTSPPPPPPPPPAMGTVVVVNRTLFISGTNSGEEIEVKRACNGRIEVEIERWGSETHVVVTQPFDTIVIYGYGGNDEIKIDEQITTRAFVLGGDGDDRIRLGGGPSVAVGGRGDDQVFGGRGRNVLIGGVGEDTLNGKSGMDILVGGYTAYDADLAGLGNVLQLWNSAGSYSAGIAAVAPLLHGGAGATVFDDDARDRLVGGAGLDWFFANTTDPVSSRRDVLVNRDTGEVLTQIS